MMPPTTFHRFVLRSLLSAGVWIAVVGSVRAQGNELVDFKYDPFARPKRAEFVFSRAPIFTQRMQREGSQVVLILEVEGARNVATKATYSRHFTGQEPIAALEVRDDTSGVLNGNVSKGGRVVIRMPVKPGIIPDIETSSAPPKIQVVFHPAGEAPRSVLGDETEEGTRRITERPSDSVSKSSAPAPMPNVVGETASGVTTPAATSTPNESPAIIAQPDAESVESKTRESETSSANGEPGRKTPILRLALNIGGGLLVVAIGLVGAGFLLAYGWTELRAFMRRRNAHMNRAAYQATKEATALIAQLREEAREVEESRMFQHRAMLDALTSDLRGVRETLSGLAQEFEKATQSVVLLKPSRPVKSEVRDPTEAARPTAARAYHPANLPDEPTELDAGRMGSRKSEQTQRKSLEDWVSRVAGTLQSEESDAIPPEKAAGRKSKSPTELAGLLLGSDRSETANPSEAKPTENAEAYERARQLLARGQSPQDIAQTTGLPVGEVELLAQLSRMKKRDRSQGEGIEIDA